MKRRHWATVVFLVALGAAWMLTYFYPPRPRIGPLSVLDSPLASMLLIVPHADDEVLAAAGLLQQAEEAGLDPHVVLVTAGDGFVLAARAQAQQWRVGPVEMQTFGEYRVNESLRGLAALGLPADRLTFLGYPDTRLDRLWIDCWRRQSPCVGPATRTDSVPYTAARSPGAPFSGESLLAELVAILEEQRPSLVVYPHPNDAHRDHWALSAFVSAALEQLRRTDPTWDPPEEWLYLIHRGDWPAPKGYRPLDDLLPPERMVAGSLTQWFKLELSPAEVERKYDAVTAHESQMRLMRRYLLSFVRSNELFGTLPAAVVPENQAADITPPAAMDLLDSPPWPELAWSIVAGDPLADTVGREVQRGADLLRVWAANDGDGLYVAVRSAEARTRRDRLHLLARSLWWDSEWSEVTEISIARDGSHTVLRSGTAYGTTPAVRTEVKGNWTLVWLPLAALNDSPAVMVNFESYRDQRLVDRTAWRLLILDEEGDAS